jgi:hydrogenase nickel incorporation protein HypA/HybF
MHEYGIAKEIINVIEDNAKNNEGWTPVRCEVQVGAFCGLNPEALEAAFPMAVEGTIAENTQIGVSIEPITCKCRNCNSEIHIDEYIDLMICENCGSSDIEHPPSAQRIFITKLEIKKGDEVRAIYLSGVEVEEDEYNHKH